MSMLISASSATKRSRSALCDLRMRCNAAQMMAIDTSSAMNKGNIPIYIRNRFLSQVRNFVLIPMLWISWNSNLLAKGMRISENLMWFGQKSHE